MEPTVHSFSAALDPLALIARYPRDYPALLESGAPADPSAGSDPRGEPPRYDILPVAIGESMVLDASGRLSGPHARGNDFLRSLAHWVQSLNAAPGQRPDADVKLPFRGGLIVYLSYEIAGSIEPTLRLPRSNEPVHALALRAPAAWIRDRRSGLCWFIAEQGFEYLSARFQAHITSLTGRSRSAGSKLHVEAEPAAQFLARVESALQFIAAGDIYQANLSRIWSARSPEPFDPVAIYRKLRHANPGPFSALLRHDDFAVISSSPERLARIEGGRVSTRPIAGTRPRGNNAADDESLIRQLLENEKERAEHVMLIDLERNDLGRVCRAGSVLVDEFMSIETYRHVHHIVSNVSGTLREGVGAVDVLRAVFPGGTITGCPKVRCMQIIADLESCARGAYTGSVGYINRDGSADFNILIRTISLAADRLNFRAGAGIVADSVPEFELAESNAKAEGLLRALSATH